MLILKNSHHDNHSDDHDFIHPYDLTRAVKPAPSRRDILKKLGTAAGSLAILGACSKSALSFSPTQSATDSTTSTDSSNGQCVEIPSETKGPYPLDGSSGSTNALSNIYRTNIIGSDISSTSGVPLTVNLSIQDVSAGCSPISGAAVYIWHCDQYGQYSGYSSSQNGSNSGKTFCRGIVVTDANGLASFTTLYPGWYAGRITHIHMAVYLNNNLSSTPKVSQLGFPQSITQAVYGVAPYSAKGQNTSITSFAADNIFSDGTTYQIASVSGSTSSGYIANLKVGIP